MTAQLDEWKGQEESGGRRDPAIARDRKNQNLPLINTDSIDNRCLMRRVLKPKAKS